ncbi:hypothetical protein ACHAPT_011296 [Fusarium lateritium]
MDRPPSRSSYGRTASRSSTSTTNTRVTMHSTNSTTSHTPQSPQLSHSQHSQHSHRFYHAACQRPASATPRTSARLTPRLTRESSSESTRQPVVSSFLQERLQKERQAEIEKSSSWSRANTEASSSGEFAQVSHGSPTKRREPDVHRPQSAAGSEPSKKKGLGVKDMEQVISSLHKQNFDLKLELYHRRERQTALEDQVEILESEKRRVDEINDNLVQEMEKRDKAIEEAVAMIITLEARLEQFAQDRAMVQQIEAEEQYMAPAYNPCYEDPAPKSKSPDFVRQGDGAKVITRMPSFLSERSENTENLRNVYLGARGSVLSLPQVPEGGGDYENGPATVLGSPSLSVLSESSFVSVYGKKGHDTSVPQDVEEPLSLDGVDGLPAKVVANSIHRPKTSLAKSPMPPSNRSGRSNSLTNSKRTQFDSIHNVIDQGSPLQQLERDYSQKKGEERPQSRDKDGASLFNGRATMSPNHRRTKEEKRESLRKVLTDAPGGVRLHDHALPPTPDTISTSTLRRFQNSNDTLSKHPTMRRSRSALSDASDDEKADVSSGARLEQPSHVVKASAKIIELNNSAYLENRGRSIQRPRSADETTVSNRRGNDWDTDSDDTDVESLESSLDIWMRESAKPVRKGGRTSPDLFSFPSGGAKGGWAMDAMFGPGNGYSGGGSTAADPQRAMDLFAVQQELFSTTIPPPPPNRRSSLNAQTAANSKASFLSKPLVNAKVSKPSRRNRPRRNSDDIQMRAEMEAPVQPLQPAPPVGEQKKNHYPPITGQQAVRNGITKLFRRSLGGGSSNNAPASAPAPAPASDPAPVEETSIEPSINGAMGVPSWMTRTGVVEDDRESATPPPIMRNPRHGRHVSVDMSMADDSIMSQESGTPGTPLTAAPVNDKGTPEYTVGSPRVVSLGPKRKWLPGFGRAAGKNKS